MRGGRSRSKSQLPFKGETVHFKSVLLFLEEMGETINPAIRSMLAYLHPGILLLSWLVDLQSQEVKYTRFKEKMLAVSKHLGTFRKGGAESE